MSSLERIRTKLGISIPVFLRLIGARPGRRGLLRLADGRVDAAFLRAAEELEKLYLSWRDGILATVREHGGAVTVPELAKLLGFSEYVVWMYLREGVLEAERRSGYHKRQQYIVTLEDLERFFAASESWITSDRRTRGGRRMPIGPQARAFQKSLARRPPRLRQASLVA